jgi:hypothetical protein
MQNNNNNFVLAVIYNNADTNKSKILKDNNFFAGVYQWKHIKTGRIYIGSSNNLSQRLKEYYSNAHLKHNKNSYISRALLVHGYSEFSLTIFKYIDITGLSKEDARKLILSNEQQFLNIFDPHYNILKKAGSILGYTHSEEIIVKTSGKNNHMYGKIHSIETIEKMSIAKGGRTIYVYDTNDLLVNSFCSVRKAAEFFNSSYPTIKRYCSNSNLFQGKWILSTSEKIIVGVNILLSFIISLERIFLNTPPLCRLFLIYTWQRYIRNLSRFFIEFTYGYHIKYLIIILIV